MFIISFNVNGLIESNCICIYYSMQQQNINKIKINQISLSNFLNSK